MGMRRAGRPELEHRQVRTEFEHQRCELRSSAGAEREHRRNDVPPGTEFEHQRCELRLAMGATDAVRNAPGESYYAQLKCHDPSGVSKPFGLLLLLPLVIAPAGAPAPFRWNVALRTRQSRLLRHLHPKDRPDLVLPGRCHPRRGRDLGRRRARTGVRGNSSPPSLSTPCNIELGQHHQVITLSPACLSTIRSVFS